MAAPIVYRWDDTSAPVARGESRSMVDILRACLVDGYGTKPAAGWTLEYINVTEDKAAFRNNPVTGTGFYLQVDGAGSTYDYLVNIQGFEVMSSENDGIFPFSGVTLPTNISSTAGTLARPWVLIADDRAFYFYVWTGIASSPPPTDAQIAVAGFYFGDVVAISPSDNYACALCCTGHSMRGILGNMSGPSSTTGSYSYGSPLFPRKSDGSAGYYTPAVVRGGGPGSEGFPGSAGHPYVEGGMTMITRPYINDGVAYSFRGFMPGFYYPCHDKPFNQLSTKNIDGKTFLSINSYNYSTPGCSLILLTDWRV